MCIPNHKRSIIQRPLSSSFTWCIELFIGTRIFCRPSHGCRMCNCVHIDVLRRPIDRYRHLFVRKIRRNWFTQFPGITPLIKPMIQRCIQPLTMELGLIWRRLRRRQISKTLIRRMIVQSELIVNPIGSVSTQFFNQSPPLVFTHDKVLRCNY